MKTKEQIAANNKKYREKNLEKEKLRRKLYYEKNKQKSADYNQRNKIKNQQKNKLRMRETRKFIIEQYGGKCECCGEKELVFLAFDHRYGNGNKHRKEVKVGWELLRWIVKNKFPDSIRILCHNCNMAFAILGFCPHTNTRSNYE